MGVQRASGSTSGQDVVETLIVGFGFSVIPLVRELELRDQPYLLISQGEPIWQQLARADRLNFDLVSSFHASFYSFDQVAAGVVQNYYPTAREFHAYHERLFARYRDRVVTDTVTQVENHPEGSVVRTATGRAYRTRNLVFATGLGRPQNETIKALDLSRITGQTLVFNGIGDTTNMMVARAVPQGNRVILLNDGFMTLDKFAVLDVPGPKSQRYIPLLGVRTGKRYIFDLAQFEGHSVERRWPLFYKHLIALPLGPPNPESPLAKLVMPHAFYVRHPETYRREAVWSTRRAKAGIANGLIGIKYYPIDMYEHRYGQELEDRIREGVLMNDIVFFHTQGLVETWPKDRTTVDLDNGTICCDGKLERFDQFIDGGHEAPRLPPIEWVGADGDRLRYEYDYRDCYLGVVPAKLRNVFFIGYTRPLTGGIANMAEMQSLMVHKLLSEPERTEHLYEEIHGRIADYNAYCYPRGQTRRPTDHLVYYGSYTNDVAHFVGIERKLKQAWSWNPVTLFKNLSFELLHPNNALKFRMRGEYAIDGAEDHCRRIAEHHEHWSMIRSLFLSTLWDHLLGYLLLLMLFVRFGLSPFADVEAGTVAWQRAPGLVGWGTACLLGGLLLHRYRYVVNLISYSLPLPLFGVKASLQPLALVFIAYSGQWAWCLALFALWIAIAWAGRQFFAPPLSGRYLFADCKFKHKYEPFWERYRQAYLRVRAEHQKTTPASTPPPSVPPPATPEPQPGARVPRQSP